MLFGVYARSLRHFAGKHAHRCCSAHSAWSKHPLRRTTAYFQGAHLLRQQLILNLSNARRTSTSGLPLATSAWAAAFAKTCHRRSRHALCQSPVHRRPQHALPLQMKYHAYAVLQASTCWQLTCLLVAACQVFHHHRSLPCSAHIILLGCHAASSSPRGNSHCLQLIFRQVRHRCPCTDEAVCGDEARLVSFLAKAGRMTPLGTGNDAALVTATQ